MIDSSAEIGKLMRRKRMKSNLVSSGTMRSRRNGILLDGNALRAPPPDPVGDDQSRYGEGGEHGGDDADAERDGEAAHRTGADIEQHRGGDEGGDIGIENGGQRPTKSSIDGVYLP